MTVPALPPASGPNPARAKFLLEVAGALEFLALWHQLSEKDQQELRDVVHSKAATLYENTRPQPVAR